MSNQNLTAMDVYSSRMDISFDVAAYCRGHKFSPEAVNLARAIKSSEVARLGVVIAERKHAAAEGVIREALAALKTKMDNDPT